MDVVAATTARGNTGLLDTLNAYTVELLARAYCSILLFSTNTLISVGTPLSALTEANYSGYARITVGSLTTAALDQNGMAYSNTTLAEFRNNGGGVANNIYSAAIVATPHGATLATGTVTTTAGVVSAPVIGVGGSGYTTTPNVTVLGGGTGAVVTATVTGGVVTALTLVAGGTGYTAATLVIDPPALAIEQYYNFPQQRPMAVSTDALPMVMQINQSV